MKNALEALTLEIVDASLYEREAELFRKKVIDGDRIGARFARFAEEERIHYEAVKQIFPGLEKSVQEPAVVALGDSLRAILRTHVERELRVIFTYEVLLKRPLPPLHALLVKGILADENDHLKTVIHYLKHLR